MNVPKSCPATLTTQPSGARLPRRMTRPPVGFSGVRDRPNDLLARRLHGGIRLPRRSSGRSPVIASACSTPACLQAAGDQPGAAGAVQIDGDESSAGFQIREQRHASR